MNTVQVPWVFKLLGLYSGKIIVKEVVGFDNYDDAAKCAKSLVPEIHGPAIVMSYM
jgi:hypothetical protein